MKRPYSENVTPEFALRGWEGLWCMLRIVQDLRIRLKKPPLFTGALGALQNYKHFRPFLLGEVPSLSLRAFLPPSESAWNWSNNFWNYWCRIFIPLAGWVLQGRRVYHPDAELQAVLELQTSLHGMTWDDVIQHLAYKSFAIRLSKPQQNGDGKDCDVILVHTGDANSPWVFVALRSELRNYKKVDEEELRRLARPDQRGYDELLKKIDRQLTVIEGLLGMSWTIHVTNTAELILDGLERHIDEEWQRDGKKFDKNTMMRQMLKLLGVALGLPPYISLLPKHKTERAAPDHDTQEQICLPNGKPDPSAITNGIDIYTVACPIELGPLERVYLGLDGTPGQQQALQDWAERNPSGVHYQPPHQRRPPNQANIPGARRTVSVSPHLKVLTDRGDLPPEILPLVH